MRILHLSADYPDPLVSTKTRAIANLLELATGHEHCVMSLNRVDWRLGIRALKFSDGAGPSHRAIAYGAPPRGLLLKRYLDRVATWIERDTAAAGFVPDLVHAHKLSVEGIVGMRLSEAFRVPLAVSIQGNSDLKIIGAKRGLRSVYAAIWQRAAVAFPFAPWAAARLDALLGTRSGSQVLLPCPTPADRLIEPRIVAPVIRTAFNLGFAQNKNARRLIQAIGRAAEDVPEIRLEIIGGGDARAFASLASLAEERAPGLVRFLGPVPHDQIQGLLNASCAFALVSHRESFGMVFSEALLAGTPCLIPRDQAIDGYFVDGSVVLTAAPRDEREIVAGLLRLVREQAALKARIAEFMSAGKLDLLRRDAIGARYRATIAEAVGSEQSSE